MKLTKENFTLFAAKNYYNPTCIDSDEFFNDIKRFKYVIRLLNRYEQKNELSETLLLNHLIVIFNVFGYEAGVEMLALRVDLKYWPTLKPFLVFLGALKSNEFTGIDMDKFIVNKLRELKR